MSKRYRSAALAAVCVGVTLFWGCSETLNPGGDGAFIQGRVTRNTFDGPPAVSLGVGLEFLMESAPSSAPRNLAPAAVTLSFPRPNPAQDTARVQVTLTEEIPGNRLVVEADSRLIPGELAEWTNRPVGTSSVTWNLRDQFTDGFLPNGLYYVRLVNAASEVLAETRLFINRNASEAALLQAFLTFTDGNGDYVIPDVPVGETFTEVSTSGTILGTVRPRGRVFLFHDDFEYLFQELQVSIGPNEGVRFDFTVDPVASSPLSQQGIQLQ